MEAKERERGMARLEREFMAPEIVHGEFCYVDEDEARRLGASLPDGSFWIESSYLESEFEPYVTERKTGWFAHLSASGYMDQTPWSGPFDTEEDAEADLVETYADDLEDEDEDEDEE